MITALIVPNSGLGNVLFQYAAARRLAIRNQTEVLLDFSWCFNRFEIFYPKAIRHLDNFQLKANLKTPSLPGRFSRYLLLKMNIQPSKPGLYKEPVAGFSPEMLALGDETTLFGYFQSQKYFLDSADTIRADLKMGLPDISDAYTQTQAQIENSNSVAVHVRCTDYIKNARFNICTPAYYARAGTRMAQMINQPRFFIFSDDMDWAQKNIPLENAVFVNVPKAQTNPVIDLSLMSKCKHQIIANSTFSWWGAWLNENPEKVVISPDLWNKDPLSNARAMRQTLPEQGIQLSPTA